MKKYIGKRVTFKGTYICTDDKLATPKALFNNVSVNGSLFKLHTWIDLGNTGSLSRAKGGDVVTGTAMLCEYIGLDGDKQIIKTGLKRLRVKGIR